MNLKKIFITILAALIAFNALSVFAETDTNYLSQKEVLKIGQDYLNSCENNEVNNFNVDNHLIKLNDTENKLIAYIVPVKLKEEYNGYLVIDARIGGYGVCEFNQSKNKYEKILNKGNDLVYIFPSAIHSRDELKVILNNNLTNNYNIAHNSINQNSSTLHSLPPIKSKNSNNLLKITQETPTLTASNETVELTDEPNFVKIFDLTNKKYYYGGNQAWFSTENGRNRGCGTTACANIAYHMSKHGYPKLYNYTTYLKTDFTKHMEEVYNYVTPWYWGIPTIDILADKFKEFAKSRGVTLKDVWDDEPNNFDVDNVANYIKSGLNQDSPVAILLYKAHDEYDNFELHWMTITKYFRNASNDDRFIATSSWGERYSFNLKILLDVDVKPGFIYFE